VHPPLIEPMPVGPGGPVAGLEPPEPLVDAVEAEGVVDVETGALDWLTTGVAAASVTVGDGDRVECCTAGR